MGLLLYKSDEMYSSTELIRKSKMIFTKIVNQEIEKAIILRDGKPSFLLMDFAKYEKIMAEYEMLKANSNTKKNKTETSYDKFSNAIQNISDEDKIKINSRFQTETTKVEQPQKQTDENIQKRIMQAREERAKILADEKQNQKDLKEELILQNQLNEEKIKKNQELKEFWD